VRFHCSAARMPCARLFARTSTPKQLLAPKCVACGILGQLGLHIAAWPRQHARSNSGSSGSSSACTQGTQGTACVVSLAYHEGSLRRLLVHTAVDLLGAHISCTIVEFDAKLTAGWCLAKSKQGKDSSDCSQRWYNCVCDEICSARQ
jgi:hypothetical protein